MRICTCAIFQAKEYRISKLENEMFELISNDLNDLKYGFKEEYPNVFVKTVNKSEITTAYSVSSFCKYKGYRFQAVQEKDDKVLIHTGDYNLYQELNLDFVERGVYDKWVDKTELEGIWEEKEGIYGFTV